MKRTFPLFLIPAMACSVATAATTVNNTLVNVDFNGAGGVGPNPTPRTFDGNLTTSTTATQASVNWVDNVAGNDFWNGITGSTSGSASGLLDSTGATTGINVTWSGFDFTYNNSNNTGSGQDITNGPNADGIYALAGAGTTGTVTISGLLSGATYNLTVLGAGDATEFTVNGESQFIERFEPGNQSNYVEFNEITTTGDSITISVDGITHNKSIGGFQISEASVVAVPEVSSVLIIGLFSTGLAFVRKRPAKCATL